MGGGGEKLEKENKQCIWIVRYGLTKFQPVEGVGPFDSELDQTEGMEHAKCIAYRLSTSGNDAPKVVYSSPFLRTAHTAQLIALDFRRPIVRVEEGLTEWQIPSLLDDAEGRRTRSKGTFELAEKYGTIDVEYQSLNPFIPKGAAPHLIETEQDLLDRCATTLDRILDYTPAGENFAIVSHAPCAQALALHLEGRGVENSRLGAWPLGGVSKFSRRIYRDGGYGPWIMEFYGDTEHMPGKYQVGTKEWCLPCLAEGNIFQDGASFDGSLW